MIFLPPHMKLFKPWILDPKIKSRRKNKLLKNLILDMKIESWRKNKILKTKFYHIPEIGSGCSTSSIFSSFENKTKKYFDVKVEKVGSTNITSNLELKNFLFIPRLSHKLLSIS